jgi:hypothetical protein
MQFLQQVAPFIFALLPVRFAAPILFAPRLSIGGQPFDRFLVRPVLGPRLDRCPLIELVAEPARFRAKWHRRLARHRASFRTRCPLCCPYGAMPGLRRVQQQTQRGCAPVAPRVAKMTIYHPGVFSMNRRPRS